MPHFKKFLAVLLLISGIAQAQNAKVPISYFAKLTADPASPTEGRVWYNTTNHTFNLRLNSSTISLLAGAGLSGAPTAIGDLLYSTSGGSALSPLADVAVGQVLHSGGVAAAPAYSAINQAADFGVNQVWVSLAELAANKGGDALLTPSNHTMGVAFALTKVATITGVRFHWPGGGGALIVKCTLWDPSGTAVKTVNVSVNAAGFYTGTFATPYALPASQTFARLVVSTYETTGTFILGFVTPSYNIANTATPAAFGGPNMHWLITAFTVAGDAYPTTDDGVLILGIEPTLTVP